MNRGRVYSDSSEQSTEVRTLHEIHFMGDYLPKSVFRTLQRIQETTRSFHSQFVVVLPHITCSSSDQYKKG